MEALAAEFPWLMAAETVSFTKPVTAEDIHLFARVTGDHDPIHVDPEAARAAGFADIIAHGGLTLGLVSTTASRISQLAKSRGFPGVSVSLGYDRIRFPRPVLAGEMLTARYTLGRWDPAKRRTVSAIAVTAADGAVVAAGEHVMAWIMPAAPASAGSA